MKGGGGEEVSRRKETNKETSSVQIVKLNKAATVTKTEKPSNFRNHTPMFFLSYLTVYGSAMHIFKPVLYSCEFISDSIIHFRQPNNNFS